MTAEAFFGGNPHELELYRAFESAVLSRLDDVSITFHKTQITFASGHGFAFVSTRRKASRPDDNIIVSFGLEYRLDSPRAAQAANPYPNRWTHHVVVSRLEDIDDELMDWVSQSYAFSRWGKKRRQP